MSKTDIATLRNARWDHLEQEVVFRIRLLKASPKNWNPRRLTMPSPKT